MKNYLSAFAVLILSAASAQLPDTDIFLTHISKEKGNYIFSAPENITQRKGYDNQPSFSSLKPEVLFVSYVDSTQSDVYSYNMQTKKTSQLTHSLESEYSPMLTPDQGSLSVVRVDQDTAQRFYTVGLSSMEAHFIEGTDSIGYYLWLNDSMLAMFILGKANTLQILNTHNSERTLIASDIGRCMKLSPDKKSMYFVMKANEQEWFIYQMMISDFSLRKITSVVQGSEDFAILPDRTIMMGKEGILYAYNSSEHSWKPVADFTKSIGNFYRLTISEDGTNMAVVGYTGKKP